MHSSNKVAYLSLNKLDVPLLYTPPLSDTFHSHQMMLSAPLSALLALCTRSFQPLLPRHESASLPRFDRNRPRDEAERHLEKNGFPYLLYTHWPDILYKLRVCDVEVKRCSLISTALLRMIIFQILLVLDDDSTSSITNNTLAFSPYCINL